MRPLRAALSWIVRTGARGRETLRVGDRSEKDGMRGGSRCPGGSAEPCLGVAIERGAGMHDRMDRCAGAGSWHEAANWTETEKATVHRVPGASDKVCIPSGVTVEVLEAAGSVLRVQSKGTLEIASSGSLALTEDGSTTANLTQSSGTLGGTGTSRSRAPTPGAVAARPPKARP